MKKSVYILIGLLFIISCKEKQEEKEVVVQKPNIIIIYADDLGLGDENLDWNKEIRPGPLEIGFDYSYIMASTNDRVPLVYVQDYNVVGLTADDSLFVSYKHNFKGEPTGKDNPETLKFSLTKLTT